MRCYEQRRRRKEGKCGGKMRAGEGKMMDADTNKDGKISKAEFMAKHEAMFTVADTNKDGMLDDKEHQAMHGDMKKKMKGHKEGKCGEGKCGANK
ncbi:MAG: EF-hand domain-containing protein [Moraxellaceae bacterium]|nr:EF-hand domain-containing protein [Moraxellaceae bacterium]